MRLVISNFFHLHDLFKTKLGNKNNIACFYVAFKSLNSNFCRQTDHTFYNKEQITTRP